MRMALGLTVLFLLVGTGASALVRLAAALLSDRFRALVLRHPVAHTYWLVAGLAALALAFYLVVPRVHGRRASRSPYPPSAVDSGFPPQLHTKRTQAAAIDSQRWR